MQETSVLNFSDFRSFLLAHAQKMRRKNPRWSYGAWARRLGLKTTSSITKIVQGTRNPGDAITEKLIEYFSFEAKEAHYFRDLVRLHKIKKDPRLAVVLMEKMQRDNPEAPLTVIDDETFALISNWYCFAVREMVRLNAFFEDPEWISKNLEFEVPAVEIEKAIQTLLSVGLLERDEKGQLKIRESWVNTRDDVASEAVKRYHESMLLHAREAIRKFSVAERDFSSISFVLDSTRIEEAKEMLRRFNRRFTRTFGCDNGDRVYQMQIQLFPMSVRQQPRGKYNA